MAEPPVQEPQAAIIDAEADDYDDDSAIGAGSNATSTTSINSSILRYREENGRTYHAYKDGAYAYPNDEAEKDRLDLQHHQFALTLDGKLFKAPIPKEKKLHRVLDVGTGTGIWAIDFADEHPESTVLGVDLSPIQPSFVPPNLTFEVDDLEQPWTYTEKFDFIYSRMMLGSFANVPRFVEQCFENLSPGGFLEMADTSYPLKVNGGKFPEDSALEKWSTLCSEALSKIGRIPDITASYKKLMIDAGFVNVVEERYIWPMNRWPKDKKLKELGMWQQENVDGGIEALSVGIFTRVLGWSKQELDVFLAKVRNEIKNTKIHSYIDIYVVYGNKPV